MRHFMIGIDQYQRDLSIQHRNNARERAVNEGRHIGRIPFGYRGERYVEVDRGGVRKMVAKGKLTPDETMAPIVRELFERAAAGASKNSLARWAAQESGVRMSVAALSNILRNRIYLGEFRHGEYFNETAHDALVDELTWKRAQRNGIPFRGDGLPRLLSGLLRCAGCRSPMRTARPNKAWRNEYYTCRNARNGGNPCPSPSSIVAYAVEAHVEREYMTWLREQLLAFEAAGDGDRIRALQAELDAIDQDLAEWGTAEVRKRLGTSKWAEEWDGLKMARAHKAVELEVEQERCALPEGFESLEAIEDYPTRPLDARRRLLGRSISMVFVRLTTVKGRSAGRGVPDRVKVIWQPRRVDVPHQGRRFTGGPFTWS
jgi:hypothetical protein